MRKLLLTLSALFLTAFTALLCGCSDSISEESDVFQYKYLPIHRAGTDKEHRNMLSMLNLETGEITFADQIGNPEARHNYVSRVGYDDVFAIEANDTANLYKATDLLKPINSKPFHSVGSFITSRITPAAYIGEGLILINTKCETVATLDKSIKSCDIFHEGRASIRTVDKKYGFINEEGKIVVSPIYDKVEDFSDGVAICTTVNPIVHHAIDTNGKELFTFTIEEENNHLSSNAYSHFTDGELVIKTKREIYLVDKTGKRTQTLCDDTNEHPVLNMGGFKLTMLDSHNGYRPFLRRGKLGLKDKDGDVVIEPIYSYLKYWGNDIYIANGDRGEGKFAKIINHKGKTLYEPQKGINEIVNENTFIHQSYNSCYLYDMDGKELTEECFTDSYPSEKSFKEAFSGIQ